jgi:uncharacterized membrane protein HdeD (DUF308 family)
MMAATPAFDVFGLGPDQARRDWQPFLAWGLVLAGIGVAAGGLPLAAEPGAWLLGGLLLVGGAVQLTTAVRAWQWGGLRPRALTGAAVYLALGAVLTLFGEEWPNTGLWAVGLLAGLYLTASGLGWVMFARGVRATPPAE